MTVNPSDIQSCTVRINADGSIEAIDAPPFIMVAESLIDSPLRGSHTTWDDDGHRLLHIGEGDREVVYRLSRLPDPAYGCYFARRVDTDGGA